MSRPYSTFKKQGKGLASFSAKRLSEHELRQAVRLAVLERDGHRCRLDPRSQFYPGHEWSGGFRLPDVPSSCGGPLDVHEPLKRSRGGNYLDADQCVVLCRNHHEWAEGDGQEIATELGLLVHSWASRPPISPPGPARTSSAGSGDSDASATRPQGEGT